jgi:3D (Asp-Asp-Asp) domain-containing protein
MRFQATATSLDGFTAKGSVAREGMVAADPAILPLGSRIRISGAGAYDGVYAVTDTGAKVDGRTIDVYVSSAAEAKKFGRKTVTVEVLSRGKEVTRK